MTFRDQCEQAAKERRAEWGDDDVADLLTHAARLAEAAEQSIQNCWRCDGRGEWRKAGGGMRPCPSCGALRDTLDHAAR